MAYSKNEQSNILVAEFMGYKFYDDAEGDFPDGYWMIPPSSLPIFPEDMSYNDSWNWLMPVIEKIEAMGYDTRVCHVTSISCGEKKTEHLAEIETIHGNELAYIKGNSKMETVFECVVEFIKSLKERGQKI